jgi:hypothetical protein
MVYRVFTGLATCGLGRFGFRFHGQTRISPGIESALQGPDILIAAILKFLRQTGAGGFIRSSAINHNGLVPGNAGDVLFERIDGDPERIRQFFAGFGPGLRIACVNDGEVFPGVHVFSEFIHRDSQVLWHTKNPFALSRWEY